MLAYLVNINIYVSDVYMDDIYNMMFHIHNLYVEQYFIQKQHDIN